MSRVKTYATTAWTGIVENLAWLIVVTLAGGLLTAITWLSKTDPAWIAIGMGGLLLVTLWIGLGVIARRLRALAPPPLSDLLDSAPTSASMVWAHVRNVMIQADPADGSSVTCAAYVVFAGLQDGEQASPTELLLVAPANDEEIAKLTLVGPATPNGMLSADKPVMVATYRCPAREVSVKALARAVRATMNHDPSGSTPAFARIVVREPNGAAQRAHKESGVLLFSGDQLVKVEGWPARMPSASDPVSAHASDTSS
jgi:hypothetical protein